MMVSAVYCVWSSEPDIYLWILCEICTISYGISTWRKSQLNPWTSPTWNDYSTGRDTLVVQYIRDKCSSSDAIKYRVGTYSKTHNFWTSVIWFMSTHIKLSLGNLNMVHLNLRQYDRSHLVNDVAIGLNLICNSSRRGVKIVSHKNCIVATSKLSCSENLPRVLWPPPRPTWLAPINHTRWKGRNWKIHDTYKQHNTVETLIINQSATLAWMPDWPNLVNSIHG